MVKILHYVFDPLCGWCYGASPGLNALAGVPDVRVRLLPSGLFAGSGARAMDDAFAAYAWSNDQRIARLSGQRFTERYRTQVLGNHAQRFDSGLATLALTAVALAAPQRELEALGAIQLARYVDGQDVTQVQTLQALLRSLDLAEAAERLRQPDAELEAANRTRVESAQALLRRFGAQGVPTLVLEHAGGQTLLPSGALFTDPYALANQLGQA
ncbi:protein-disulfide isomerase [Lampropedia cohaerens]|uniref:Protein-disulfide isomerase n=1 Tax=Lampropedia cohaerens TaxID=1610491 RepID=A0A0U1Q316_9BURK|nr:DsbA family protein [Lampropedia cohaerens]KKW69136.1 protein-disulfide isomerase [Lampropedia cohaerens]